MLYFKDLIKNEMENKDFTTRYAVVKIDGIQNPVIVSLQTNANHGLNIKLFETDFFSLRDKPREYLENPFNKDRMINYLLYGCIMDEDGNDQPRPICQISTTAWKGGVSLNDVYTREDMRRKGIASFAVKLVQDYYTKNNDTQSKITVRLGSDIMLYSGKYHVDEDLKYKTRFEHDAGTFGEILSNVKAKVLKRNAESAFKNFLVNNHFYCESHPYQRPFRPMYRRDILDEKIVNEDSASQYIQIFDSVLDFDPQCVLEDLSKNK